MVTFNIPNTGPTFFQKRAQFHFSGLSYDDVIYTNPVTVSDDMTERK